jgi:hypothetical protein
MTHDRSDRDAPGGRSRRLGAALHAAPPSLPEGEAEPQAERSEEPFALLRAALDRREQPDRARGVRD